MNSDDTIFTQTENLPMYDNDTKEKKISKSELCAKYAEKFAIDKKVVYASGVFYFYKGTHYEEEQQAKVQLQRWFLINESKAVAPSMVADTLDKIAALTITNKNLPFWKDGRQKPKDYIPFKNGILNLVSRELIPHTANFVCHYCLPYDFDPTALCPQWHKFLNEIFGDEKIDLLQEWFGYCLTSDISFEKALLSYGPPRSGKGTVSTTLQNLLGKDNAVGFSLGRLMDRFSTSYLVSANVAIVSEIEISGIRESKRILEVWKSIIGGDPVPVEKKGVDLHDNIILPTKFHCSCNTMPVLPDASGAMAERLLILPFTKTFAGHEDRELKTKLIAELPGIAQWALVGLTRLQKNKVWTIPKATQQKIDKFRLENSNALWFLKDCCRVRQDWLTALTPGIEATENQDCFVLKSDLKIAFDLWAENTETLMTPNWNYFGRDASDSFPNINLAKLQKINGKPVRVVFGVELNAVSASEVAARKKQMNMTE